MTRGFPQQNPLQNFSPPKSEPLPQHGQSPDKACLKGREPRTRPRPGH